MRAATGSFAVACALSLVDAPAAADVRLLEQQDAEGTTQRYLDVGVFGQPAFVWRQPDVNNPVTDTGVFLQSARLTLHGLVHPMAEMKLEIEGVPSPNLADVWAQGNFFPWLKLRAGQFKVPFLRTYQFSTTELAFTDRLIYTSLSPDRSYLVFLSERDIGGMLHGRIGNESPKSMLPVLDYQLGVMLGRGPNQTRHDDHGYLLAARIQLHALGVPDGEQHEGDLARNKLPKLSLGAGAYSNCDDRADWNRGLTTDIELRWQGFYASGSLVRIRSGPSSGIGNTLGYGKDTGCAPKPDQPPVADFISSGRHAQAQYVLPLPERVFKKHTFELLFRWDSVNPRASCDKETGACGIFGGGVTTPGYVPPPTANDADNAPTRGRATFGINYYPTGSTLLKVQLNYQLKRLFENVLLKEGTVKAIKEDAFWLQVTAGL